MYYYGVVGTYFFSLEKSTQKIKNTINFNRPPSIQKHIITIERSASKLQRLDSEAASAATYIGAMTHLVKKTYSHVRCVELY